MTKKIQSYKELLQEKERLQSLLQVQRQLLRKDISDIGKELEPVRSVVSLAGKLVTRDGSNLVLNAGANTLIDLVVKKLLLSKSSWVTRLAIPFLLKNYSSHLIAENKQLIIEKLFSWIGKKNTNGHETVYDS